MTKPNYSKFNLDQLQDALSHIDKEQFPEDAKLISALIQAENVQSNHNATIFSQKEKSPLTKKFPYWTHLVTAGLLFALALYIHFANKIPLLNIPLDLDGGEFTKLALVLSLTGSGVISVFHFFREHLKKKNDQP